MSETVELDVLQDLVPELEADGFDVYIHPNKPLIPGFLGDFRPDALAIRADKSLVVEVLRRSPHASKRLERITALLQGQKKWELRVVWIDPTSDQETLQVQDIAAMQARILEIKQIAASGHIEPAMLMAWATFEALARAVLTKQFGRPQTPDRLIQILAGEGYLTPTEADGLRALAEKRNKLIHGELQVRVSAKELQDFASVLETMLQQVPR
jgi:uncharacterized protein YutE (UPF0331/DUF86 family)